MAVEPVVRRIQEIRYRAQDDQILFVDDTEDRFLATVGEVIHACSAYKEFINDVRHVRDAFAEWLVKNRPSVRDAYCGFLRGGGLRLVVVAVSEEYDFPLSDKLADFELRLYRECPKLSIGTLLLPNSPDEAIDTFIPERAFRLQETP